MFANNLPLVWFILRRDRVRSIIWLIGIFALAIGVGGALSGMYPTPVERMVLAETLKNPAMVAMMGPVYEQGGYTIGAMFSNMMLLWTAMVVAIMNIFIVVRHTRQDEERGRIEVIRSLPVGRLSTLSSTLSVAAVLNIIIAAVTGLGLSALGIESMDFQGSMLFGAAMGVTGLIFAAVTAIFCQLCASPRTASGLSFAFLGVCYMLRALGDMQSELVACISPLGLILRIEAYTANQWWPVGVVLIISAAAILLAFYLCAVRDMGEGIVPARPGKIHAAPMLSSPGGLALRLLRVSLAVWVATVLLIAMAYGSIMGDLESFISTNELLSQIFTEDSAFSLTEQFITFLMVIMSILETIPVLSFIIKARSQERGGYAENILACPVSRDAQLLAYFSIAFISSIIMPVLTAVGFWSASVGVMEDPIKFALFLQAALVYIPAIWIMLGLAMLLIAFLPRMISLAWAYLGFAFFAVYIGSLMDLPEFVQKLSPFGHIPQLPVEEINVFNISVLVVIAFAMFALGFIGYRKRDMQFS